MNYKEFINQVFLNELSSLINEADESTQLPRYRYHMFVLLGIGIETLGAAFDDKDWHERGESKIRFNNALKELSTLEKYQDKNLYKKLRCGMSHVYLPVSGLGLNVKSEGGGHNTKINGQLVLTLEDFFEDFKDACKGLIEMIEEKDERISSKVYNGGYMKFELLH